MTNLKKLKRNTSVDRVNAPFERVYLITSLIPKGKITTYKNIACLLNINPRRVGLILSKNNNPDKIPCHRVVGSNGKLTGYRFGGIKAKMRILKKEGVVFNNNGYVNLKLSLYKFPKSICF